MDQKKKSLEKKSGLSKMGHDEDYVPQKEGAKVPGEAPNGKWSEQENELYIRFLQAHLKKLETDEVRRANKIFMNMSRKIKSRTADQCRGHHRKLLKVCGSVEAIIAHLEARKTMP